jgi:hypothetical protein
VFEVRWKKTVFCHPITSEGITPGAPRDHPQLTSAHLCGTRWGGERCRPMLTRQNSKGNIEASSPKFCPLSRLRVNRTYFRFGRYKNPRRPHPPPRASRVSHHPPQVSGLTLTHPCSPTLTRPRPPPPARPIDSGCAGPFLAPGQRGRNELPQQCRF